jgi:uncharacterized protein
MTERIPPAPTISDEVASYWAAANDERLRLRRCLDTGKAYFPPRERSPFTGSTNTEWFDAAGLGTLYAFSVLVRTETPYCLAYVMLDEGPILLTNISQVDFNSLCIGQRVRAVYVSSTSGQKVPMFTPLQEQP